MKKKNIDKQKPHVRFILALVNPESRVLHRNSIRIFPKSSFISFYAPITLIVESDANKRVDWSNRTQVANSNLTCSSTALHQSANIELKIVKGECTSEKSISSKKKCLDGHNNVEQTQMQ